MNNIALITTVLSAVVINLGQNSAEEKCDPEGSKYTVSNFDLYGGFVLYMNA